MIFKESWGVAKKNLVTIKDIEYETDEKILSERKKNVQNLIVEMMYNHIKQKQQ